MYSDTTTFDLIVIGGGASGLMASGRAGERGKKVLLLEKNPQLGEKLKISGGGRCNITNAEYDTRELLQVYGKAEKFLHSLFSQFGVTDTFSFFESRGLPLIVEARKRAFPKTEKAGDVLKVLETYVHNGSVTIKTSSPVTEIHLDQTLSHSIEITGVSCGSERYTAKEYLFATGSLSHPETGSTGDGFLWLNKLGHHVEKPTPTIVPLATKETWSKTLKGVSLLDMKITFLVEGKRAFTERGELLFTHFGLSGPLVLNNAHKVADLLHSGIVTAFVDMFPDTEFDVLEKTIVEVFDNNKNKTFKNIIRECVPEGMGKGVLVLLSENLDITKKVHSITKEERKDIVRVLKALPITVTGLMGFNRAVIADGGIPLEEVDMKTMHSNKVSNLYITGDLLHVSRPSGGFSLQLCWSSGYVAGSHVGSSQDE